MIRKYLLLVLIALPAPLLAQNSALRVEGERAESFTPSAAFPRAYPLHALELLGARILNAGTSPAAVLYGDTLRFDVLSPYFRAGKTLQKLPGPVRVAGSTVYLPEAFFSTWLPARYPDRVKYQAGVLSAVGRTIAAAPAPAPQQPAPKPAAPVQKPVVTQPAVTAPAPAARQAPTATDSTKTVEREQRVVIIDAGHGGRDPGKVGPNGLPEKHVTLAVARRLATILQERGYEVHLTRNADTLVALSDRPRLANRWKAGRPATLFLSLHANSAVRAARGFETYFLSDARTEDERRVAEMENEVVKFEDPPAANDDADPLGHILKDLRNDFYMLASNDLAETVQSRLAAFHPGPNRGVKQAGFVVLVGALMPAVLVELAFVSNPEEARLLGSSAFQHKLAWSLLEAVEQFFDGHEHLWATEGTQ